MINPEDVTIIIPHLGNSPVSEYALDQCLLSLEDFPAEVFVVHNGLNDCKHHAFCPMHINYQGQCRAVNAAVAASNTPWVLISNDDMVYPLGWFERLTSWSVNGRDPLCISPQLVEPRPGAPTFLTHFCGGAGGDFNLKNFSDFVIAAGGEGLRTGFNLPFLIRRDVWDTIGGYDRNYDPWGSNSDSDLEYKIRLAGIYPNQNTNCLVYHFSQTSGTFSPEHQGAWAKNWDYFIKKWGFPRTDQRIWEADFPMPTKEEGRIYCPEWEGKYD